MQPNATLRFKKIPMKQRRTNCDCTQQTDLTNYTISTAKAKLTANNETIEASVSPTASTRPAPSASLQKQLEGDTTTAREESSTSLTTILAAINTMKTEFLPKFDDIMSAIENVRRDITDCSKRLTQPETRTSTTEDDVTVLQGKVKNLEGKN